MIRFIKLNLSKLHRPHGLQAFAAIPDQCLKQTLQDAKELYQEGIPIHLRCCLQKPLHEDVAAVVLPFHIPCRLRSLLIENERLKRRYCRVDSAVQGQDSPPETQHVWAPCTASRSSQANALPFDHEEVEALDGSRETSSEGKAQCES